ncbi:MAG: hypothetical protein OXN96_10490 [Bryobacterales bacterium]|nr:hypothetical protein [Bryobacterales bacterium]
MPITRTRSGNIRSVLRASPWVLSGAQTGHAENEVGRISSVALDDPVVLRRDDRDSFPDQATRVLEYVSGGGGLR